MGEGGRLRSWVLLDGWINNLIVAVRTSLAFGKSSNSA